MQPEAPFCSTLVHMLSPIANSNVGTQALSDSCPALLRHLPLDGRQPPTKEMLSRRPIMSDCMDLPVWGLLNEVRILNKSLPVASSKLTTASVACGQLLASTGIECSSFWAKSSLSSEKYHGDVLVNKIRKLFPGATTERGLEPTPRLKVLAVATRLAKV